MEPTHTTFKTTIRTDPPATEAIDPRLVAEAQMLSDVFARAGKQAAAERKAFERKSTEIRIAEFPA